MRTDGWSGSTTRVTVLVAIVLSAACKHAPAGPPPQDAIPGLAGAPKLYTLTNLHPDDDRVTMYSGNFQQPGLIPVCSEVIVTYADESYVGVKVVSTQMEYGYYEHAVAAEPLLVNFARYVGRGCPQAEIDALTPLEKEGVRLGAVKKGMRKQAVILAVGYPPLRDTASLDLPVWRYWISRTRYFTVTFDSSGVVQEIKF